MSGKSLVTTASLEKASKKLVQLLGFTRWSRHAFQVSNLKMFVNVCKRLVNPVQHTRQTTRALRDQNKMADGQNKRRAPVNRFKTLNHHRHVQLLQQDQVTNLCWVLSVIMFTWLREGAGQAEDRVTWRRHQLLGWCGAPLRRGQSWFPVNTTHSCCSASSCQPACHSGGDTSSGLPNSEVQVH